MTDGEGELRAMVDADRSTLGNRIRDALDVALGFGSIEGDHHRAWVVDQMVRKLTGPHYLAFRELHVQVDDEGESWDSWEEGIAP